MQTTYPTDRPKDFDKLPADIQAGYFNQWISEIHTRNDKSKTHATDIRTSLQSSSSYCASLNPGYRPFVYSLMFEKELTGN